VSIFASSGFPEFHSNTGAAGVGGVFDHGIGPEDEPAPALSSDRSVILNQGRTVSRADCWVWPRTNKDGYGVMYVGTRARLAHVYLYEQTKGRLSPDLELDHLCRNRACFNPKHLEPVTHRVNLMRGKTFAAHNAKKTHCPAGHPYKGDNLIVYRTDAGKHRMCRMCKNLRAFRARKGGAS
jgi:hypothetical protein